MIKADGVWFPPARTGPRTGSPDDPPPAAPDVRRPPKKPYAQEAPARPPEPAPRWPDDIMITKGRKP